MNKVDEKVLSMPFSIASTQIFKYVSPEMTMDPCLLDRAKDIRQRDRQETNFYCYVNTEN